MDRDLFGSYAVAVFIVLPFLLDRDLGRNRRMLVRDRVGSLLNLRLIFRNRVLFDRVDDLDAAVTILRQIRKGVFPMSVSVGRDLGGCNFDAVREQMDRDLLGSYAVPVLVVLPFLLDRNLRWGRCMLVDDLNETVLRFHIFRIVVLGNRIFGDSINDFFCAVLRILRKIGKRVFPVAVFIRRHLDALHFHTVGKEVNRNLLGTNAVPVFRILPILFNRKLNVMRDLLFGSPVMRLLKLLVGNVQLEGDIHPYVDVALAFCNTDHWLRVFAVSDFGREEVNVIIQVLRAAQRELQCRFTFLQVKSFDLVYTVTDDRCRNFPRPNRSRDARLDDRFAVLILNLQHQIVAVLFERLHLESNFQIDGIDIVGLVRILVVLVIPGLARNRQIHRFQEVLLVDDRVLGRDVVLRNCLRFQCDKVAIQLQNQFDCFI